MLYSLVHLVASQNVDLLMTSGHIDVFEILCMKRLQNEHTELNRLIPMLLWVVVLLFFNCRFALKPVCIALDGLLFFLLLSLCEFYTWFIKIYCDVFVFLFWPSHIVYHAVLCRLLYFLFTFCYLYLSTRCGDLCCCFIANKVICIFDDHTFQSL